MKTIAKIILWIIFIWLGLGIFVVIFYAEENWRGNRDWQNCKHELEAKGEKLDWNAYVPPPVPDDQNFFKAPKMQEWFVKSAADSSYTNELTERLRNADTTATNLNENAATKYLAWSDQFEPDFDLIRKAIKRPYARMDGGYSDPVMIPIPNFVALRIFSQTLAQRAKCYLILHQPEKALSELTLLNDSRRLLEAAPTGKPMTLVAAMINVAVVGLYADSIADGFRLHAWQEPQLVVLQKQLGQVNLFSFITDAMAEECATVCYLIDTRAINKLGRMRLETALARGWFYENMVTVARWHEQAIEGLDFTNKFISPKQIEKIEAEKAAIKHFRPYTFMAAIMVPSYLKAFQVLANIQTTTDEAQIACALERYHLAHGEYPATLDALAPQFIETIPHDIIGGQPLHYRRTDDGKFLIYSVGWNETDDGGLPGTLADVKNGDWVWKN